jgi:hypothetical protein
MECQWAGAFRITRRVACLSAAFSTTNPTWLALKSNMNLWSEYRLTCGTAFGCLLLLINYLITEGDYVCLVRRIEFGKDQLFYLLMIYEVRVKYYG